LIGHIMISGILNGLRVLDYTRVLAGPYATRFLADFGAEVIKVQSKKTTSGAESDTSGYFNTWNRNKRSITLDMSYSEARELALRLTAISDVVIENFSPRVMLNWGLDYKRLKDVRPDLIMVSMSGMGHTGPWKDFVAFGPTIQALSGITSLTSFSKDSPTGLGYSYADHIASLYAVLTVLAALGHRDKTGQGQYIDISEYEAMCTLMGPALLDVFVNSGEVLPQGNRSDYIQAAPYGCYKCLGNDRWCVIAVFDDAEWEALCNAMGRTDLSRGERFLTLEKRKENVAELDHLIGEWTAKYTAEEVVDFLQESDVSAGVVQNAKDLAKDPQLMARKFFVTLKHPVLGSTIADTCPIKFNDFTTSDWKAAPLLGEDNRYVYIDLLGLTEKELSSYIKRGIVV